MNGADIAALSRQSGLMREMQVVANNIANASTTGFRREGVIFSEHVERTGGESISMAHAGAHLTDQVQGSLDATGAPLDLAIEGEGFFTVATPQGDRLTRAGAFSTGPAGEVLTPQGHQLLDAGGAPVLLPPDAGPITVSPDGTIATELGPIAQIQLVRPVDGEAMRRGAGTLFEAEGGTEPVIEGRVLQGHLEDSNVDPVREIARMIEVQRAYELGQSFLTREDERLRGMIQTMVG